MMNWQLLHPQMTPRHLGFIPSFLSEDDPRPAKEQFNENYISGWSPLRSFTMGKGHVLNHPEDPPMRPLARLQFREELILFYEYAWVAVVQPDGSFEVSRLD